MVDGGPPGQVFSNGEASAPDVSGGVFATFSPTLCPNLITLTFERERVVKPKLVSTSCTLIRLNPEKVDC